MLDLALNISKDKYLARINLLDVQLNRMNQIKDEYQSLINQLDDVVSSDDSNYDKMKQNATMELTQLETQITNAQTCRALLQKTVDQMDENQTYIDGIADDAINTIGNTVSIAKDAANVAAAAAGVAAVL